MVSQRWRRDTEVPPNLSTIQVSEGGLMGIEVVARPRIGHEHAILGLAVAGAHPARLAGAASFSPNDTGRLHFPPASLFPPQGPSRPPAPTSSPTSSPTAPAPAIRNRQGLREGKGRSVRLGPGGA